MCLFKLGSSLLLALVSLWAVKKVVYLDNILEEWIWDSSVFSIELALKKRPLQGNGFRPRKTSLNMLRFNLNGLNKCSAINVR